MKKTLLVFIPLVLIAFSCEKALFEDQPANSPYSNFEELWTTIDEKYAFFDYKNIDWDSIRNAYRPRIRRGMSRRQLFDVCSSMLFELKDGHVNLISTFDVSRYWAYYLDYPVNFDYDLIERNYLGDDYEITGPFRNTWIDSTGYVYYGSFGDSFSHSQVDYLLAKYQRANGLIIDVRNNGGGYTKLVQRLAGHFVTEKLFYARNYFQNGPGHQDFAPPEEKYIEPSDGIKWTKPVVLLTNRKCFSATNTFVLAMTQLENVRQFGDHTGGGGGIPISAELPNGWTYRFSASKSISPDGFNIENGIPPDEKIGMSDTDIQQGRDTILEYALETLRKKRN